jgi:S-adenosylmethionine hydrolase
MKTSGIITLTTDFGLSDPYVAAMKGVILSINPEVCLVDVTHQISPAAVFQGAAAVLDVFPYFPEGTVHLVVVDPGVGSERRGIVVERSKHFFVGPDNGLFGPLVEDLASPQIIHLTDSRFFLHHVSPTFHGRDVFAPVAAHISRGVDPRKMGIPIKDPAMLDVPRPYVRKNVLYGQVVRVAISVILSPTSSGPKSNLSSAPLSPWSESASGCYGRYGMCTPWLKRVSRGPLRSSSHLEIAVNLGRASERLGTKKRPIRLSVQRCW